MISREMLIAGGVGVAAVIGLVYAATASAAPAAAPAGASLVFKAGHRYQVNLAVPATGTGAQVAPTLAAAQAEFDAIASGAFAVAGAGLSYPGTAAPGSAVTVYFLVDVLVSTTISQAVLLTGTPAGTTVTATDEGLSPAAAPASTSTTSSSTSTPNPPGAAASSSSSSSSNTSPTPPAMTTVLGGPPALGSGVPQWLTTISLGTDTTVPVSFWPGDTITVQLPSGATWAAGGSSAGVPTSGSAAYSFVAGATLGDTTFAWTVNGLTYSTICNFRPGRTWAPATQWGPLDTVRIGLSSTSYATMGTAVQNWPAEAAALAQMANQIAATIGTATTSPAQGLYYLLTTGPWAAMLGVTTNVADVLAAAPSLLVWVAQSTIVSSPAASSYPASAGNLPSDWPSDPTSILRAEFQSQGIARKDASALPFPLLAWIRTT